MKRLALLGFPEGLARQDIAPTNGFSNPIIDKSYLESATPIFQSCQLSTEFNLATQELPILAEL